MGRAGVEPEQRIVLYRGRVGVQVSFNTSEQLTENTGGACQDDAGVRSASLQLSAS